jgi:hypothetical protein
VSEFLFGTSSSDQSQTYQPKEFQRLQEIEKKIQSLQKSYDLLRD